MIGLAQSLGMWEKSCGFMFSLNFPLSSSSSRRIATTWNFPVNKVIECHNVCLYNFVGILFTLNPRLQSPDEFRGRDEAKHIPTETFPSHWRWFIGKIIWTCFLILPWKSSSRKKLQQQENDDDFPFFNAFASSSLRFALYGIFSFCFVLLVFSVEWQMLPPE